MLQKTITTDFLTHKRVVNDGHVQQYYVENSHPAIVPKETFQAVQAEIERRGKLQGSDNNRSRYTNKYPFSGKIFCGGCGEPFRRKYWGTGKYKKAVWLCRTRMDNGPDACELPAVDEEKLQAAFMRVVSRLITDKDTFVKRMTENIERVFREQAGRVDITDIVTRVEKLRAEMAALVKLNLTTGIDAEIYKEEYERITGEIERLQSRKSGFSQAELLKREAISRVKEIDKALKEICEEKDFDEELFRALVGQITVGNLVQIEFVLWSKVRIMETI